MKPLRGLTGVRVLAVVVPALLTGFGEVTASEIGSQEEAATLFEAATNVSDANNRKADAPRERFRTLAGHSLPRPVSRERDHIYGRAAAATSLVTYMDFSCPWCRRQLPVLLQTVSDSAGDINWVYRHFPLNESSDAPLIEALASECAAEQAGPVAFWEFSRALLTMPRRLTPEPATMVQRAARKQGLDWNSLDACIQSDRHRQAVLEDRKEAVNLGVVATPTIVLLRGKSALLLEGLVTTDDIRAALERLGH
jgi:protein-disulfide isomerase